MPVNSLDLYMALTRPKERSLKKLAMVNPVDAMKLLETNPMRY